MSLFVIFAKWLSITFAGSLMNFIGIPSGNVALSKFNELIIFFMFWVVACGKLNLLFCVADNLMTITFGWSWYVSIIFPTVVSSIEEFTESPNEDGLVPEDFCTILIQCSLNLSVRIFSSNTSSSLILTTKNPVTSPNFLAWKFYGKGQFPHSFWRFTLNLAETVSYIKFPHQEIRRNDGIFGSAILIESSKKHPLLLRKGFSFFQSFLSLHHML